MIQSHAPPVGRQSRSSCSLRLLLLGRAKAIVHTIARQLAVEVYENEGRFVLPAF